MASKYSDTLLLEMNLSKDEVEESIRHEWVKSLPRLSQTLVKVIISLVK